MSDNRYWVFPDNAVIFVFTPWEELPFRSLKIVEINDKNFKSLEGRVIHTKTAWDTIQLHDSRLKTPIAYSVGKIEEFKPPKPEVGGGEEVPTQLD
ncbi:hypothetical protein DXG01_014136 [Tephrocybe rancida]|nr:hypothetical protein DXG01_014136 [Tephrocybe rancida]